MIYQPLLQVKAHTLAVWAHLWADLSTRGSPVASSYAMASRQVSRHAEPSTPQPDFSAPISRMPPQSLVSHHLSSHSTCTANDWVPCRSEHLHLGLSALLLKHLCDCNVGLLLLLSSALDNIVHLPHAPPVAGIPPPLLPLHLQCALARSHLYAHDVLFVG